MNQMGVATTHKVQGSRARPSVLLVSSPKAAGRANGLANTHRWPGAEVTVVTFGEPLVFQPYDLVVIDRAIGRERIEVLEERARQENANIVVRRWLFPTDPPSGVAFTRGVEELIDALK